jgi:hypothetical protein
VHLPDASGADVVVSLRERAPDVPIIAVAEEAGDLSAALRAGASDVLPPDAGRRDDRRSLRYATSLQKVEAELRRHQTADELTGLFNSRGFELLAGHHLRLADRSKQPVIIVFVRLDLPGGGAGRGVDRRRRRPDPLGRPSLGRRGSGGLGRVLRPAGRRRQRHRGDRPRTHRGGRGRTQRPDRARTPGHRSRWGPPPTTPSGR